MSTTLAIVMLTTLIFGTFMKVFQEWLLGKPDVKLRTSMIEKFDRKHSFYEEIKHPNLDMTIDDIGHRMSYLLPEGGEPGAFSDSKFAKWFVLFDENKLRPFLIRNYTVENVIMQDIFNELITKEFDDKNPDNLETHIEEVNQITRRMSIHNNKLMQSMKQRSNSYAENDTKRALGTGPRTV